MHAASYKQAMAEDRGEHKRTLKAGGIGYRFALASAAWEPLRRPGQTLTLRQEWVNRNRSWCVYPYRLKLYLVDAEGKDAWTGVDQKFDPCGWLQGSTNLAASEFPLPKSLRSGIYDLRIALVDETGIPRVRLAISDGDTAMRYKLGSVALSPTKEKQ